MVGHAGSPTGIVHADVTLTRSKVKVKVTELVKLQKLHCCRSYLLRNFRVELKTDG